MVMTYFFITPPVKNQAWEFWCLLDTRANVYDFQTSVTLAEGDVTILLDGVDQGNIDTLPTEVGTTGWLYVQLSAAEMNGDKFVGVKFHDQADEEWRDRAFLIPIMQAVTVSDLTASGVWSHSTRTLTQSAVQVAATVAGKTIALMRGDTLSAALTGLGSLTGYTSIDFTVKDHKSDTDDEAVIRIRKNASEEDDGLLRLNGEDASDRASNGSITIDNEANGNITIALAAAESDDLAKGSYFYDIQKIAPGAVSTLSEGIFVVTEDVLRAIT